VAGKVEFKYKNIEKVGEYYLFINTDNLYSVYNKTFDKVSDNFKYIVLFNNYYAAVNNNNLNIYSYNSRTAILEKEVIISSNDFNIDFTNGFEITVDGKIYKFDKSGKEVIEEPNVPEIDNSENEVEGDNNEE